MNQNSEQMQYDPPPSAGPSSPIVAWMCISPFLISQPVPSVASGSHL